LSRTIFTFLHLAIDIFPDLGEGGPMADKSKPTIQVEPELHYQVKIVAATLGIMIQQAAAEALRAWLPLARGRAAKALKAPKGSR
jgi:hypothetical protein